MGLKLTDVILFGKATEASAESGAFIIRRRKILFWGALGRIVEIVVKGVPPLVLPDAIEADIVSLKAFGGTEQRNLPDGYTELEYIESSGTQYIDTGVAPTNNTVVKAKILTGLATGFVFGSRTSSGTSDQYAFVSATDSTKYRSDFYNNVAKFDSVAEQTNPFEVYKNKNVCSLTLADSTTVSVTNTNGTFTSLLPVFLFACNSGGSANKSSGCKIYYFQLWQDTTLTLNMIPCKNASNVIGMYDTVSGTFFTNDGTGDFVAGPDTVPTPTAPMDIICNNGVLKYGAYGDELMTGVTVNTGETIVDDGTTLSVTNAADTDYIEIQPNTTYLLKFTRATGTIFTRVAEYDSTQTFISPLVVRDATNPTGVVKKLFTTSANAKYIRIGFQQGSTDMTLKTVGVYVNGTVETIRISGNLVEFNETRIDNNTWPTADKTKGFEVNADVYGKSVGGNLFDNGNCFGVFVPCKKGQSVSIDFFDYDPYYSRCYYCEVTADGKVNTAPATYANSTSLTQKTFTLTQDDSVGFVIEWYITAAQTRNYTKENYTVVAGTTPPTQYIPFNICTATCEDLLSVGTYTDEQEVIAGNVTRKIGVKVLDGTESWTVASTNVLQADVFPVSSIQPAVGGYCTALSYTDSSTLSGMPENSFRLGSQVYPRRLYVKSSVYATDATTWTNYLTTQYAAGTPVIVVYPLATETTETVTGQPMATTQGDNTAEITQESMSGLELEVTYNAGVVLTIQEVEDAQLSPDVEVTIQ